MDTDTLLSVEVLATLIWLVVSMSTITKIIQIRRTPTTWISALPARGGSRWRVWPAENPGKPDSKISLRAVAAGGARRKAGGQPQLLAHCL